MARSSWKPPFCHPSLLKLIKKAASSNIKDVRVIKTRCRSSVIIPACLGLRFAVYNGKTYVPVNVNNQNMIGYKFGEFSPTRKFTGHSGDKKAVKR
ncbi:30S ribosomal protein S19 [Wolbachia endosymbiont of Pentidionis agamae]|uniref:30S ribosomal protein S19 n=1 Tax=Wolbachia endosymbiont of Pentidionis agamae TaxID=3110435 RepID=UPI002FD1D191